MSDELLRSASAFWNREATSPVHRSWLEHADARGYANELISGPRRQWPIEWFHGYVGGKRFERGLSIGCGTGALERDVLRRGLVREVDAFDGAGEPIRLAREAAVAEGLSVAYHVDDFNRVRLPRRTYDIVFFHQSLHHVAELERLLAEVMLSLRSGGGLYVDEYVGPSRHEWCDLAVALHRSVFGRIPAKWRTRGELPLPIQDDDPSEAIRSGEILQQVRVGFDLRECRPYGGTLLSVLCPVIDWTRAPKRLMLELIEFERELLRNGVPSYYGVYVATPKSGRRKVEAGVGYLATRLRGTIRTEARNFSERLRRIFSRG